VVDADDLPRAADAGALDDCEADAAATEYRHRLTRFEP
jgi:hypothetical protein